MKKGVLIVGIGLAALVVAQDPMSMTPPKEMKNLEFVLGDWTGNDKVWFGPEPQETKSQGKARMALGGRFIHWEMSMEMPGMGTMHGLNLLSYDETTKKYKSFWFDNMAAVVMESEGEFQGDKLVFVSKPTSFQGMEYVMRSTFQKKSDKNIGFVLEMKQGDAWQKMMEGNYTKK